VDYLDLAPIRRVRGTVKLPGSKSISNRILLLAGLAAVALVAALAFPGERATASVAPAVR